MNRYGVRFREAWTVRAPEHLAMLTDPVGFFTALGLEVQGQVSDLAARLEADPAVWGLSTTPFSEQTYVQQVSRRQTAVRMAEEVVMSQQLAWIPDPSLSLPEAREEWEQTRPADENLIVWAERMQDSPYPVHSTVELEQKAKVWAVPLWFLEGLTAAEIPRQYAREHQEVLAEAANVRFLRQVR